MSIIKPKPQNPDEIGYKDGFKFFIDLYTILTNLRDAESFVLLPDSKWIGLGNLFFKSILYGYDNKMTQLLDQSKANPVKLESDPNGIPPLAKAQEHIKQYIFDYSKHRETFITAYQKSLDKQTKELDEALLVNEEEVSKITKKIREKIPKDAVLYKTQFVCDWVHFLIFKIPKALESGLAAGLDDIGREIGGQLAEVSTKMLSKDMSNAVAEYIPALFVMSAIYDELNEFIEGFNISSIISSLYYPIVGGFISGLQASLAKDYPEVSEILKSLIDENYTDSDRDLSQIYQDSYKVAREYCEGTEVEKKEREKIKTTLANQKLNFTDDLTDARNRVIAFFERHNHVKICVIELYAVATMIGYSVQSLAFQIGKLASKAAMPLSGVLSKYMPKGLSLDKQDIAKPKPVEAPVSVPEPASELAPKK